MRLFSLLPMLLLLSSAMLVCRCSAPESPPIQEETFARLYAELLIMAADDSARALAEAPAGHQADSLLRAEGVTRDDYLRTVDWYNQDVTRWRELLAKVVALLERRSERADSLISGSARMRKGASENGPGGEPPR